MHYVEFCKIKQRLNQFNVLYSLSGTLYDSKVGQSSIIEHNLISFYLERFADENMARGQERSDQPAERTHTQNDSGHPNSSLVCFKQIFRGREIDNSQQVAPDNTDDIDFSEKSQ